MMLSMEVNIWEDCWILSLPNFMLTLSAPKKKRLKKSIIPVPLGTIPNENCWVFSIKILTWFNLRYSALFFLWIQKTMYIQNHHSILLTSQNSFGQKKKNKLRNFTVMSAFHLDQSLRFQYLGPWIKMEYMEASFFLYK